MSLHNQFTTAVRIIRDALGAADVGQFIFTMTATGRTETDSDSVKIEYVVGDGRYGESVTGDSVEACLNELLRRKGWTNAHAPLRLTDESHMERDLV